MIPSPQLKLNLVNLSGEETKPPAPENPGFPLDAPSKKILVEEEFIHNDFNLSKDPWKRQGIALTGFLQTTFLIPIELGPNHVENAAAKGEEDIMLSIDS